MKKLVLVMIACSAVACGDKKDEKGTPKGEACTTAGAQKCSADGKQVLECTSGHYTMKTTCTAPAVCKAVSAATFTCQAPQPLGEEGDTCDATHSCADGLHCFLDLANADGQDPSSTCMANCTPGETACGAGNYCAGLFDTNNDDTADEGVCEPKVGTLGACFDPVATDACTEPGESCVLTDVQVVDGQQVPVLACTAECDATHVNVDAADCPNDLTCLPSPAFFETESTAACSDDSSCTTAQGFHCIELTSGPRCARHAGVCGTPLKLFGDLNEILTAQGDELTADAQANLCDAFLDGYIGFCGLTGVTDPANAANVGCFSMAQTGSGGPSVCVAECEGAEGDLDCGTGYHCGLPAEPLFFNVQAVSCTAAGDDSPCAQGFHCTDAGSDGLLCVKPATASASAEPQTIECTAGNDAPCNVDGGYHCNALNNGTVCSRGVKTCLAD